MRWIWVVVAVLLVIPAFVIAQGGNPAAEFKRDYSWQDGGRVGLYQVICSQEGVESPGKCKRTALDISSAKSIVVNAKVKILYNTLKGSGWWSDLNNGDGEYPVGFWLHYSYTGEREDGAWRHGFLPDSNPDGLKNFNIVPRGEWGEFTSENIVDYLDRLPGGRPKYIDRVMIAGNGWDYISRADNIEILVDGVAYPLVNPGFSNGKDGWEVEHGSNVQDVYEVNIVRDNSDSAKPAQPPVNQGRKISFPFLYTLEETSTTLPVTTTTAVSSGKIERIPLSINRGAQEKLAEGKQQGFLQQLFSFFGFLFGR